MNDSITLIVSCHCGGVTASYTLPKSSFPLKSAVCSCNSCRHVSAMMWNSFAVMPPGYDPPSNSALKKYKFSEKLDVGFCSVCGATIFNIEPSEWELASGVIHVKQPDGVPGDVRREGKGKGIEGLLNRQMLFVDDTGDGGGTIWMPHLNSAGLEMKRHVGHRWSPEANVDKMLEDYESRERAQQDRMNGYCHCGAVKVYVTRPSPGVPEADKDRGRWWLADPEDTNCRKYTAKLDACDSCRLCVGFDIMTWIFVPEVNVFRADGKPFDPNDKALSHYNTSKTQWRSFCNTCGAFICHRNLRRDVQVVDFGTGLFDGDGARLEDWVKWKGIEYVEDAVDRKLVDEILAKAGSVEVHHYAD